MGNGIENRQTPQGVNFTLATKLTSNEQILDRLIRHQTYIQRFSGGQRNSAIALLEASESAVNRVLATYIARFEGVSPVSRQGRRILREFGQEVAKVRGRAWFKIQEEVDSQFSEFALLEAQSTVATIEGAVPVILGLNTVPSSQLIAIAELMPFRGRTLSEWQQRNADIDIDRIVSNAKIGMVNGESPTDITRRVIGTVAQGGRDGEYKKAFRDLESVYLTVTNGISNQVKQSVYKANSGIISTELYVATLDIRTTLVCGQNDGKTFRLGRGPVPPLHFRCRSLRVPYINPDNFGDRPMKPSFERMLVSEFAEANNLGDIRSRANLPRGTRTRYNAFARRRVRELTGGVPATRTFDEWLRMQSVDFQNEYLGIAKARIYREGGFSLSRFVARDGSELNLTQLEQKGLSLN